ncbi:MAG: ABC transporter permease DevC [Acidobacteriota bacterium]
MDSPASLAWAQLSREKRRLLAAVAGVAFAVLLMLMQLGFQSALLASTVLLHNQLHCDIVLLSPQTDFLTAAKAFPEARLYQTLGVPGVASCSALYLGVSGWRNHVTGKSRPIFIVGVDPDAHPLEFPDVERQSAAIHAPDALLFDAGSRPEYGPVGRDVRNGNAVVTELGGHRVSVAGLFEMGPSFAADGAVVTSAETFLRLFPSRKTSWIDVGLVRLEAGADEAAVRARLDALLPDDVLVLTKRGYANREVTYWTGATPIGFIFGFGVIMGFAVGGVIVYQILFASVSDHLPEYATLRAMGFTSTYLRLVVLGEAWILAALGYLPGAIGCDRLFRLTRAKTLLPMALTSHLLVLSLALTIGMCSLSALLASRKLHAADPAEIF